jgi:Cu2+-exporting ATPase
VQVIASGRLMRRGVLLKSATALERLAGVDTVVLDKTGTLTEGRPVLAEADAVPPDALAQAAALAGASRHPLARAVCRAAPGVPVAGGVREVPGCGLALATPEGEVRLGRRGWAVEETEVADGMALGPELWLARPGRTPIRLGFTDPLRADAAEVVATLLARGLAVELLSGDRGPVVAEAAGRLGIDRWRAGVPPAEKAHTSGGSRRGRRVLMVGDGLNDAPALAAATVSLSPRPRSTSARPRPTRSSRAAGWRPCWRRSTWPPGRPAGRQNLALALAYNALAVPLAVAGFVTPLLAAVAMSTSSLLVVGNALRLSRPRPVGRDQPPLPDPARPVPGRARPRRLRLEPALGPVRRPRRRRPPRPLRRRRRGSRSRLAHASGQPGTG